MQEIIAEAKWDKILVKVSNIKHSWQIKIEHSLAKKSN